MSNPPSPQPDPSKPPTLPKFSRYRSVRRAIDVRRVDAAAANAIPEADEEELSPDVVNVDDSEEEGMSQSRARYKRTKNVVNLHDTDGLKFGKETGSAAKEQLLGGDEVENGPAQQKQPSARYHGRSKGKGTEDVRLKADSTMPIEEDRRVREKQQAIEVHKQEKEAQDAETTLAEQKRQDLKRLEAELEAATPAEQPTSSREKLGFLSRKFGTTKTLPRRQFQAAEEPVPSIARARTQKVTKKIIGAPQALETPKDVKRMQEASSRGQSPVKEDVTTIKQGGGGIVPQTDAPVSASNAGERFVKVQCKKNTISLSVNADTKIVDLIRDAQKALPRDVSDSHSILTESYDRLGLERRLRRYEYVRDIMNSWDTDQQNSLVVQNSDSPSRDYDLAYSHAPRSAPQDLTVYMYHSQQPGKWNKRYITLLSMGQIFVSKRPYAKVTDKDVTTICHLSDFDIYTPIARQTRKYLKPPKKTCHAIKSQQKTNIFLNTENFVHFFSTDDEELADKWYSTVQQWRSWYLVYKLGEGRIERRETTIRRSTAGSLTMETQVGTAIIDRSPYSSGMFHHSPERYTLPSNVQMVDDDSEEENRPRQIPFHLRNGTISPPPPQYSRRDPAKSTQPLLQDEDPSEEFAAGGLLGRSYTQRRNQQQQRQSSSGGRQRGSSSPRSTSRSDTAGSGNHKPLLDFSPTFKEAKQWDKSGQGHGVRGLSGRPLVESATGPQAQSSRHVDLPSEQMLRRDT